MVIFICFVLHHVDERTQLGLAEEDGFVVFFELLDEVGFEILGFLVLFY
jgi:hypothetical protein